VGMLPMPCSGQSKAALRLLSPAADGGRYKSI